MLVNVFSERQKNPSHALYIPSGTSIDLVDSPWPDLTSTAGSDQLNHSNPGLGADSACPKRPMRMDWIRSASEIRLFLTFPRCEWVVIPTGVSQHFPTR